ncbi:MAG: hypothetical protein QG610_2515, partial [Euryarchaeota archaeon]|nr:hypothetical protein [Euryarchaeota archaeon]
NKFTIFPDLISSSLTMPGPPCAAKKFFWRSVTGFPILSYKGKPGFFR